MFHIYPVCMRAGIDLGIGIYVTYDSSLLS